MIKKWIILLAVAALIGLGVFLVYRSSIIKPVILVTNFNECQKAGYPIMESYPAQCRTPEGQVFIQTITEPIPIAPVEPRGVQFGGQSIIKINQKIVFSDGLSITLKEINDSRCKDGVQCIWEGELSPVLLIEGGTLSVAAQEVRLGTVRNKNVTVGQYTFGLSQATENTATVVVSKN